MKSVDAHENRDAPIIDFVDTGCPALPAIGSALRKRYGVPNECPAGNFYRTKYPIDEIQTPKPEFRDQAEQGTQALAHPCARRSFAGGLATRLAPPVRPRAGLRA